MTAINSAINNRMKTPLPRMGGEFNLDQVTSKGKKLPNRVILHAKSGWGKTSFAAQIPGRIFLMAGEETGLWTLMDSGQVADDIPHFPTPAAAKHELETALLELAIKEHPHKALVIDSITMVERFLHEKVCQEKYKGDWSDFNAYGADQAMKTAANEWDSILVNLDRLREKGMGIFLIAHSEVVNFKNPNGPDYERWAAAVSKHSWKKLMNWADMVLFGDFETYVDKQRVDKNDAQTKGKARGGETRTLLTEWRATHDAKNRHGLPEEIDCGKSPADAWKNFRSALSQAANAKSDPSKQ